MKTIRRQEFFIKKRSKNQKGVVLLVALVILMVMTIAGLALVRTTSSGINIAGNLALKQSAVYATERGLAEAVQWLTVTPAGVNLDENDARFSWYVADGYRAEHFVPTTFNWNNASRLVTDNDGMGNSIRYVVHRLCTQTGESIGVNAAGARQSCVYGNIYQLTCPGGAKTQPKCYSAPTYRVTARVTGPRDTVSYKQMFLY